MFSKYVTAVAYSAAFKCEEKSPFSLRTRKGISSDGLLLCQASCEAFFFSGGGLINGSFRNSLIPWTVLLKSTHKKIKIFKGCGYQVKDVYESFMKLACPR